MRVLEASLAARVEAILGDRLLAVQPVERGYSSTQRWLLRGRTGTTNTSEWKRPAGFPARGRQA